MGSFSDALIMKGMNEGLAKGRAEVQSSNIRQAIHFKFGGVTDEQMQMLLRYCDDNNLLTRILQAESLEALLMSLKEQP